MLLQTIEAISGVSKTPNSAPENLMQQIEMQDIQNTNLPQQVNETYESSLQSLAQSTGDVENMG